MTKQLKSILRFSFFLGLGLFFIWWSIKDLTADDKKHITNALHEARFWLAIPGLLLMLLSHWLRGLRWKLLIEPLGYQLSTTNVFYAIMVGYLANQAVPRLGEVLKCSTLARYEKVPIDKLFGTVILERLFDTLCLLLIFGITLAIQPDLYNKIINTFFSSSNSVGSKANLLILAAAAAGLMTIGILAWMLIAKKSIRDVAGIIKKILLRVWEGLTTIRHLKKRWAFIFYTIAIWLLYTICGWIGFLAFQEMQHFGFNEMMTVLCAGSIGMIVTPGGIGAYAFLLQKTMQLFGANSGIALAYGWLMWLMQIAVVLVGGLYSLIMLPIKNKTKTTW